MLIKQLAVTLVMIGLLEAKLVFNTNWPDAGEFLKFAKNKHGSEALPEDSFATSPVSIVVSDGVGGSAVTSKFLSQYVAYQYMKANHDLFAQKDQPFPEKEAYFTQVRTNIETKIWDDLQVSMDATTNEWIKKNNCPISDEDWGEKLYPSATMMGVSISGQKDKNSILLHQKGDSLFTLFRLQKNKDGNFYYWPVYMTSEKQSEFNAPWQFNPAGNDDKENFYDEIEIEKTDIVVIGSDGLFDNVHLGLMTFIMNMLLFQTEISPDAHLAKVLQWKDLYTQMLDRKIWVVWDFYKRGVKHPADLEDTLLASPITDPLPGLTPEQLKKAEVKDKGKGAKTVGPSFAKTIKLSIFALFTKFNPDIKMMDLFKDPIHNALSAFFNCPILEIIGEPEKYDVMGEYLSSCIKNVFEKHLNVKEARVNEFLAPNMNKYRATILAGLAHHLSNRKENYPSVFSIRSWKHKKGLEYHGTGKSDDISTIAMSFKEVPEIPLEKLKKITAWLDAENELYKDIWTEWQIEFLDRTFLPACKDPKLAKAGEEKKEKPKDALDQFMAKMNAKLGNTETTAETKTAFVKSKSLDLSKSTPKPEVKIKEML